MYVMHYESYETDLTEWKMFRICKKKLKDLANYLKLYFDIRILPNSGD